MSYECPSCKRAERKPPGDCVDPWHVSVPTREPVPELDFAGWDANGSPV